MSVPDITSLVAVSEDNEINPLDELEHIVAHAFGDFSGALSWALPWSAEQRKKARDAASDYLRTLDSHGKPGLGILDHLNGDKLLSSDALADPASALETLVRSPRGQALGLAVQTRMNSVSTDTSIDEHALAGIQLILGRYSIDMADRSIIADFDLADPRHWGQTAAAVVANLREFLQKSSKSSPAMSGLTAYVVLAAYASVYLIKDIPDSVRYGSSAWVNLAVAAAVIEAQTPGKVANMTFGQVMLYAEHIAPSYPQVTQLAHTLAIIDWGFINGLIEEKADDRLTDEELNTVNSEFNRQLKDRLEASNLLTVQIPTRKDIALAKLKQMFPAAVPFEERLFYHGKDVFINGGRDSLHSVLDIAMMGGISSYTWKTDRQQFEYLLPAVNTLHELDVENNFTSRFGAAIGGLKQGIIFTVRHLIARLPLADRENLEYGKIDFYQRKTYSLSTWFWGRNLTATNPELLLRVERNGEVVTYFINLHKGEIGRSHGHSAEAFERVDEHVPSVIYATELFASEVPLTAVLGQSNLPTPKSYSSERTRLIAQTFVKHLDLDNEDILLAAKGHTTSELQHSRLQAVADFLLNLIPFKSAITSFIKGDYLDGAVDLFLDVLGFVTAGVSVVAKLTKLATSTASALTKALRAARIIGTFVLSELNPLSVFRAAGELLGKGIVYVGVKGLQQLRKLRGAGRGTQLLFAVGTHRGSMLMGTFKIGEHSMEGIGVFNDGNWYRYDARTDRIYGAPADFHPTIGRVVLGGFDNRDLARFAVKPSEISHLKANAPGIFRSADGQRFYIRNIDAAGEEAVYRIRNDFTLSDDLTDVIIIDPATNRAHGSRLRRAAPDQWEPLAARGGDLAPALPVGTVVEESTLLAGQSVHISTNPLNRHSPFTRKRLPNGLWEPVIETISARQTSHLLYDWGSASQVRFSLERTNIHEALSTSQMSRYTVATELLDPVKAGCSKDIAEQLTRSEGGAQFMFVMERVQPAGVSGGDFNALKIHDPQVDGLPKQANAVAGYWAPQGGYVDIPLHPQWGQADHLFTPGFSGCSLVVDQMDATRLRVRHVEGAKELAQYNNLGREEHGLGLSASMEFHDYGLRIAQNGAPDSILTGFAFMKYDRTVGSWKLHYQSSQGAASIVKFSSMKP
ncbi:hypothetical protein, partial [Pseudomonas sp. HMWF021]|uniref:hypothetical protein n=1 Tax=Pseudomonas sp. HMWF021 TaxID=2056857 RepID=UPI000D34BD49